MRAFMCDVCGKSAAAQEITETLLECLVLPAGLYPAQREVAPDGWFGVSRVVGTTTKAALCCSTDCVMRFVHQPRSVEATT